jgi:hypothetical protein
MIRIPDSEPRWRSDLSEDQIASLLNWYSYNKSSDDAKQYFIDYLKETGTPEDQISKLSSNRPRTTIGWLCRMVIVNGSVIPTKITQRIDDEKNRLIQLTKIQSNSVIQKKTEEKKPNIQENLENQYRQLLGDLSIEVDQFLENNCESAFSCKTWLKENSIKHIHSEKLSKHFDKKILSELQEVLAGKCDQLKEAYSFLSKSNLKKFIEFISSIINDCQEWTNIAKQISLDNRAVRVKKPKPPMKQVAKLNFQKQYQNIESIPPTKIVGASQLWVFNTKTRTLGVYNCTNSHGFTVKGSSIMNFDTASSVAKTLRKPEETLKKIEKLGKVAMRQILPGMRTKEKKLTGRINKDTILLKVF